MNSDGFHLGSTITAGVDVGVFSASVSVTGDYNQNWSSSNTTTSTIQRQYTLAAGDVCAPTTIQYTVDCEATMIITNGGVGTAVGPTASYEANICNPDKGPGGFVTAIEGDAAYKTVCQAATQPQGVQIDVNNVDGQTVWAIQGCMAS
jgi:hypothetical protein